MILVIDNYDSFTYNLVQYLGELGADPVVFRNDKIDLDKIAALSPSGIIISPGPGSPKDAGISKDVIANFGTDIPTLGVCLGQQCIGEVFGATIIRGDRIMHGKISPIFHDSKDIFEGVSDPFNATRYHSLVIDPKTLKEPLVMTAWTLEKEIMGIKHKDKPIWGVQFHPESILTKEGKKILKNFLTLVKTKKV